TTRACSTPPSATPADSFHTNGVGANVPALPFTSTHHPREPHVDRSSGRQGQESCQIRTRCRNEARAETASGPPEAVRTKLPAVDRPRLRLAGRHGAGGLELRRRDEP